MSRSWFEMKADKGSALVVIYDEIGDFGITAKDFHDELTALGPVSEIELAVNSPGGSVFDGLTIHNMLKRHKARVTGRVDGIAASIASVILMAADKVVMPRNTMMMVHDPSGVVVGTSKDMRELADAMDKIKEGIVSAYAGKTGKEREEVWDIMASETWLTAAEAVEAGFADELEDEVKIAARFDFSSFRNAPESVKPRGPAAQQERRNKETPDMTDKTPPAAEPEAAAKETPEAAADAENKSGSAAAAPAKPEVDAVAVKNAERQRTKDIVAACTLAGCADKATGFIDSDKSLSDVLAELRPKATAGTVSTQHDAGAAKDAAAAWDKRVERLNARAH